jgi:ABC transport system ATP-binding/permease protein
MNIKKELDQNVFSKDAAIPCLCSTPEDKHKYLGSLINIKTKKGFSFQLDNDCRLKIVDNEYGIKIVNNSDDVFDVQILASSDGTFSIFPVFGTAVSINGIKIEEKSSITDGDWVLIESSCFKMQLYSHNKKSEKITNQLRQHDLEPNQKALNLSILQSVLIGRSSECDLIIDSPLISRKHAKITKYFDEFFVEDCESTNGTFLNSLRVKRKKQMYKGDSLGFAGFEYIFDGIFLHSISLKGQTKIVAQQLTKIIKDKSGREKRILDDISFAINPGEFVGIFGTSGSGKSTLLDALNGRRKATSGHVFYNGLDLYESFDLFKATIGYVPQQDIVHRKIIMQNALRYTAEIRLPIDTTRNEIIENVKTVIDKVGLSEKALLPVETPIPLSGGQFKRVSLAVELVSNPNVLFLDEVTSGLDAGNDKKMMQLFRRLAENGKTVICITHTLENIDTCHLVLLLHQGKLIYFGPPQSVTRYFGIDRLTDIYELLEENLVEPSFWQRQFKNSELFESHIRKRLEMSSPRDTRFNKSTQKNSHRLSWASKWRQTKSLISRYCELILSDRRNLLILILQSPIIALIIGVVYRSDNTPVIRAVQENQIVFILVISSIWFGCLNSVREFVKELPIYLRERSVNLQLGPYLISKLVPLSVLCFLQCVLLISVIQILINVEGNILSRLLILFMTSMSAMSMGLCVSSVVNATDKALAVAPMLLIPQVILSGAIFDLHGIGLKIAKISMISYWSYDAVKSTLSENVINAVGTNGIHIIHVLGNGMHSLYHIIYLNIFFIVLSIIGLKLKDYNQK